MYLAPLVENPPSYMSADVDLGIKYDDTKVENTFNGPATLQSIKVLYPNANAFGSAEGEEPSAALSLTAELGSDCTGGR